MYNNIKPTDMLETPKNRNFWLSIWAAARNTFRIPSGFRNGMRPSNIKTNASAAKRSEKLISNNHFHHIDFHRNRLIYDY